MIILFVSSRYNYGDSRRGDGYEYANFIPALLALGHIVLHFDSSERRRYRDFADLNQDLLHQAATVKPDVIFAVQTHFEIWSETWLALKQPGGPILINWGTDDSWRYKSFSRLVVANFDAYVTTDPRAFMRFRAEGRCQVVLSQWAVSSASINAPLPSAECTRDVSFIGTARPERVRWIRDLRKRGVEVDCFGHGFPNGPVPAADIPRLMRESRLSLNFADSARAFRKGRLVMTKQLKARVFEVAGASTLLLTESIPELAQHYEVGSEVDVFADAKELADRIDYYIANPVARDSVALGGYRRTLAEHTYERRFARVLEFAREGRARVDLSRQQRGGAEFKNAVLSHRSTDPFLRFAVGVLLFCCRTVWGRRRGPRAARRLAFEISWRLAGTATFSARGLPGRLFYDSS